jgi:hypothetical protein
MVVVMSAQPIALWLADKLEDMPAEGHWLTVNNAAAELRRLHSVNAELLEALDTLVNGSGFAPAKNLEKARLAIAKAQE